MLKQPSHVLPDAATHGYFVTPSESQVVPTKLQTLGMYRFYRDAPARLQKEIARAALLIRLKPGTYFYHRGGFCKQITLIGAGSMRVFVTGESGHEVTLYHAGGGETCVLNLMCAMRGMRAPAAARVEGPLHGVALPVANFREWVDQHEIVRDFLFEAYAARMVDIVELMEQIAFARLDRRLAEFLLGRFAKSRQRPPVINATHEEIAMELGTAREVVSRVLGRFERTGLVRLGRARVTLQDRGRLRTLVQQD